MRKPRILWRLRNIVSITFVRWRKRHRIIPRVIIHVSIPLGIENVDVLTFKQLSQICEMTHFQSQICLKKIKKVIIFWGRSAYAQSLNQIYVTKSLCVYM